MAGSASCAFKRDLKGSFKRDIDTDVVDVEVDVHIDRYFCCLRGVLKSVQVLLNGKEVVMVLTRIILN